MPPEVAESLQQQTIEHSMRSWALRGLGAGALAGLAVLSGCSPNPSEVSVQSTATTLSVDAAPGTTEVGTTTLNTVTRLPSTETTTPLPPTTLAPETTVAPVTTETPPNTEVATQGIDKISIDKAAGLQLGLNGQAVGGRGYMTEPVPACPSNVWRVSGTHGSFMVSFDKNEVIDAIEFDTPAYSTLSGIAVGSRPADIDKAYGDNILNGRLNGDGGPYDVKIFQSPQAIAKGVTIIFSLIDNGDGRGKVVKYITVTHVGGTPIDC